MRRRISLPGLGATTICTPRRTRSAETPLMIFSPDVPLAPSLHEGVRRRAGSQLGKLAHRIDRVTVRLHRISGPKGAPAFRCRVVLVLPRLETIVVEGIEQVPQDAFDRAIEVAARTAGRALTRHRRRARRRRSRWNGPES